MSDTHAPSHRPTTRRPPAGRARRLAWLFSAFALFGLAQAGRGENYFHTIPGDADLRPSSYALWIPDALTAGMKVRGVVAISDYAAGAEMWDDLRFRDWAADQQFALMRYDLQNRDATLKLAKTQPAVDRLFNEVLPHFATESGRPELAHAGLLYTGLSQAGWQAVALADLAPDRAIATLPIHDSTFARDPALAGDLNGLGVPSMHLIGDRDNINGGSLAAGDLYAQTIRNFVDARRANGALVAASVQQGAGHTAWEGDNRDDVSFMLGWMSEVVALRVPHVIPDGPYALNNVAETDGWAGDIDLTFQAGAPFITVQSITTQSFPSIGDPSLWGGFDWLPNAPFAATWAHYNLTGEHVPVPEPTTLALFGLAGVAPLVRRRRRRQVNWRSA